jgi:hypothetical protein
MRWLVTMLAGSDLAELRRELEAAGGRLEEEGAVPLEPAEPGGAPELVVPADGPDDLPDRLRDSPTARQVYPDSELGMFGY